MTSGRRGSEGSAALARVDNILGELSNAIARTREVLEQSRVVSAQVDRVLTRRSRAARLTPEP